MAALKPVKTRLLWVFIFITEIYSSPFDLANPKPWIIYCHAGQPSCCTEPKDSAGLINVLIGKYRYPIRICVPAAYTLRPNRRPPRTLTKDPRSSRREWLPCWQEPRLSVTCNINTLCFFRSVLLPFTRVHSPPESTISSPWSLDVVPSSSLMLQGRLWAAGNGSFCLGWWMMPCESCGFSFFLLSAAQFALFSVRKLTFAADKACVSCLLSSCYRFSTASETDFVSLTEISQDPAKALELWGALALKSSTDSSTKSLFRSTWGCGPKY